nr:leucine-rich repeat domain-containing protein [Prevotella sp.]
MRTFTFKGLFLTAVFMLLGCLSIQAADDDLITRQITIKLDKAGTLPDKIGSSKKNLITKLKIVGEVNGTDWCFIREMAGSGYDGKSTEGKLSVLDLSEAKIVEGGYYYNKYYYYENDVYYYKNCYTSNDVIGKCAFKGCSGLTSLTLPAGITEIGDEAFEYCSGLTSLTLPDGITEIGSSAFFGCSGLTSLTLPAGITSIGDDAFYGCSGLTSITIPNGVTQIDKNAFRDCTGLTSLTLPANIKRIGESAFYGCSGLTSLTIPDGVTKIGKYAFSNCSYLTSLTIPSSVNSLGDYAFKNCSSLQSVHVSWSTPISAGKAFNKADVSKCTLYVPQGTEQDYFLADVWGDFGNIVEYDPTGIDKVTTSTDAKELSRYSVNGQRLATPTKGLNIVKYSDGSVKKVVVQ